MPAWPCAGERGAGGKRELRAALAVELAAARRPARCCSGLPRTSVLELADLVAGEPPVAGVDVAAGLDVLVEHEAAERGLGAGRCWR